MSKRRQAEITKIEKFLLSNGFTLTSSDPDIKRFTTELIFGPMEVSIFASEGERTGSLFIPARVLNVEQGNKYLMHLTKMGFSSYNEFSGKWNMHLDTADEVIEELQDRMRTYAVVSDLS
jgi:hypothetical protein